MIYAHITNSNTRTSNGEYIINAFENIRDFRVCKNHGWKLQRISRREVEDQLGSRKIYTAGLDSEHCGYAVYAK